MDPKVEGMLIEAATKRGYVSAVIGSSKDQTAVQMVKDGLLFHVKDEAGASLYVWSMNGERLAKSR